MHASKDVCVVIIQETLAERKAARRAERDALARGEMPDSLKKWRVSTLPGAAHSTALLFGYRDCSSKGAWTQPQHELN